MTNFKLDFQTDIFIVFCDTLFNDISGITNVELADWPIIDCTGKVEGLDMNSDPICV